jgi:flagellin
MTLTFDNAIAFANGDHVELVRADGTSAVFEFVDSATPLSQVPGTTRQVLDVQYDSATQSVLDGLNALVQRIRSAGFGATVDGGVLTVSGGLDVVASAIANGSTVNGDADADPATYEVAGLTSDAAASAAGVRAYQVVAGTPTIAAGATFGIANGARAAIAAIDGAIETVGARMAMLGSASRQVEGLQDFAASLYDSVKEGLGALVDADLAAESAQLTALQAKQQLAVQSLSIANQTPQSLLTLFK